MARARNSSLLAKIPKRGRDQIARIMAERDGHLTLEEILARNWKIESLFSPGRCTEMANDLVRRRPSWSLEQARAALPFLALNMDLRETAIARRFTLNEPAELGRGLAVLSRLRWLEGLIAGGGSNDATPVLEAFAIRDLEAVKRLTAGSLAVSQPAEDEQMEFLDLLTLAIDDAYHHDDEKLRTIVGRMAGNIRPWQEGLRLCLAGLADRHPDDVADGLRQFLDGMRRLKQKDELEEAVSPMAHGLYRLCEWTSPTLVVSFSLTEPLPWDEAFHTWSQQHPDPFSVIDLNCVAPALHDAVVRLRPPEWFSAESQS